MPFLLLLGKLWGFAAKNWKIVLPIVLALAIGGYIVVLRNSLVKKETTIVALQKDIKTTQEDIVKLKDSVGFMAEGMNEYKKFVDLSIDSIKQSQNSISKQNVKFLKAMDNLVGLAQGARRIQDAPRIPFFMPESDAVPVGVDNGLYRNGLLSPAH